MRVGMQIANSIHDVTDKYPTLTHWLRSSIGRPQAAIDEIDMVARSARTAYLASVIDAPAIPNLPSLISPVEMQDVWAAGITYESSRDAHTHNGALAGDLYERVFRAERPELYFKAQGRAVVSPYGKVGVRKDSASCVPEPELALLLNPALEAVGYGIGLDMTARDLERESPLYVTQAKLFTGSCALGPGFVLQKLRGFPSANLRMIIMRGSDAIFEGEVNTNAIQRSLESLTAHLGQSQTFPDGVVLLTGCGIHPPHDFTLKAGDSIRVTLDGVGKLHTTALLV
jgi:2-dehydro-3-deoxy-D-arabinonate dehydratase